MTDIEHKIGFDRIREMLAAECSNALARQMAAQMTFGTDYDALQRELDLAEEMRQVVMFEGSFPTQDFTDMSGAVERLRLPGTAIELTELFNLKCSLHTVDECVRFLIPDEEEESAGKYRHLSDMASEVYVEPALLRSLDKLVDDHGELYDTASEKLLEIRRSMARKRVEAEAQLSRSLARAKREGWAPENAEATIRNGRPVIPMLDTHRRKLKGIIHDESATRQTAFVEPAEVVELGNDLRQLEFDERHEVQKILLAFSDYLRPLLDDLAHAYHFLARIDLLRAKARLALTLGASRPIVDNEPKIGWLDARHPLLFLQKGDAVVPFSMELNSRTGRILIISGPNAGGKSVCLKAVGLIQYMLQCGLLVPCRATSEFGLFDDIYIDIGDQQSIDNDLSTYTSHLQNMKQLLAQAGAGTLFLLDELGGGTEPRSGCAIAEAVLEELDERQAFGVVTTHFADLKLLADSHPKIVNGAMLFDTEQMCPLYRLAIGHPGSSFAFEIARNIGFPDKVLNRAADKVGHEMLDFEHQLQQIELDKQEIARQKAELEVADNFLAEVTAKYQRLNDKLESKKNEIIGRARQQAQQILTDANRTVEQTISDIKSHNAEREATLQAREKMRAEAERNSTELHKIERKQSETSVRKISDKPSALEDTFVPVEVGTIVRIDGQDTFGEVVEIKGRKAVVESNSIRMTIALDRLHGTRKQKIPTEKVFNQNARFQSVFSDINERRRDFNPTLDLRGQRADEAIDALTHFIDDAILLSEKEVRILHGKGFGILKQVISEYLRANPEVRDFRSERLELGGAGITVVTLK
ncbi:MAG: Smr/MutS family protein [Bacteroidales bacterium]|nr:Smr/MutS family protein [Bacteroidales bacterium]